MNKTQINYFVDRVKAIETIKIRKVVEVLPLKDALSDEYKLGQILTGKATVREDITPDKCFGVRFLSAFIYEGEAEIEAFNNIQVQKQQQLINRIKAKAQKLCDVFVLEKIHVSDVPKALDDFIEDDLTKGLI